MWLVSSKGSRAPLGSMHLASNDTFASGEGIAQAAEEEQQGFITSGVEGAEGRDL